MAGKEMPRKVRSQTGKSPCCPQLSNMREPEKTEVLFLKMQRKYKRPQIRAPPRELQLCIRKKTAILAVKHYNRAPDRQRISCLAPGPKQGLSNHPSYVFVIKYKTLL